MDTVSKNTDIKHTLALVNSFLDMTDSIGLHYYNQITTTSVFQKQDGSYCTQADTEIEQVLRNNIQIHFPNDAIIGEEFSPRETQSHRCWIIDPIDATHNYMRGIPIWATLIALQVNDTIVLSAISSPGLNTRWFSTKEQGAFVTRNNQTRKIRVSDTNNLEQAALGMSSLKYWGSRTEQCIALQNLVQRTRGFGDFYIYMLVAEGALDIAIEPDVRVWDLAAPAGIIEHAGGTFTSLTGEKGPEHGSALATNGKIHEKCLSLFSA